jgi:hypothetical protein
MRNGVSGVTAAADASALHGRPVHDLPAANHRDGRARKLMGGHALLDPLVDPIHVVDGGRFGGGRAGDADRHAHRLLA